MPSAYTCSLKPSELIFPFCKIIRLYTIGVFVFVFVFFFFLRKVLSLEMFVSDSIKIH